MAYRDPREFLAALHELGQLRHVTAEVDWNEEVGAIAQELWHRRGPAPLFENIKGYAKGECRKLVLDTHMNSVERLAVALEMPPDAPMRDLVETWRTRIKAPLKPVRASGPAACQEVVHEGAAVDLETLPIPKYHRRDGGRYINTWSAIITKDPETGEVNVGNYRGMIYGKNQVAVLLVPLQGWGGHARKWHALGKKMPIAVVNGADPLLEVCASTPFDQGVSELDVAGGLRRAPLELVPCKTVDLEVPAWAETVLEGEIDLDPATFVEEGPFGEYCGHFVSLRTQKQPVIQVKALTHRRDPIYHGIMCGNISPAVGNYCTGAMVSYAAVVQNQLERVGIKGVTGLWMHGAPGAITVVGIRQTHYGQAREVAAALWSMTAHSFLTSKFVIVVDEDVDLYDPDKVLIAVSNRVRPAEDMVTFPGTAGGVLDPSVHPSVLEATGHIGRWDRVLIDATWPFEWAPREEWGGFKHPPSALAEPDVLAKVRARWTELGLDT